MEMGHSSAKMLLTRYLGMDHVTAEGAAEFWGYEKTEKGPSFPFAAANFPFPTTDS